MIYQILKHSHSGLRWFFLLALVLSLLAILFVKGGSKTKSVKVFASITMGLSHLQLLIGFVLYFVSPKVVFASSSMSNRVMRFFLLEHALMMLIALILITVGYISFKKSIKTQPNFRKLALYYSIALALCIAAIPWPFLSLGGSWY